MQTYNKFHQQCELSYVYAKLSQFSELLKSFHLFTPTFETISKLRGCQVVSIYFFHHLSRYVNHLKVLYFTAHILKREITQSAEARGAQLN